MAVPNFVAIPQLSLVTLRPRKNREGIRAVAERLVVLNSPATSHERGANENACGDCGDFCGESPIVSVCEVLTRDDGKCRQ